jgi:hypothetical protein
MANIQTGFYDPTAVAYLSGAAAAVAELLVNQSL